MKEMLRFYCHFTADEAAPGLKAAQIPDYSELISCAIK